MVPSILGVPMHFCCLRCLSVAPLLCCEYEKQNSFGFVRQPREKRTKLGNQIVIHKNCAQVAARCMASSLAEARSHKSKQVEIYRVRGGGSVIMPGRRGVGAVLSGAHCMRQHRASKEKPQKGLKPLRFITEPGGQPLVGDQSS